MDNRTTTYQNNNMFKIKIRRIDIISLLIVISCTNVEFLNMKVHGLQTLLFYARNCFIFFLFIKSIFKCIKAKTLKVFGENMVLILIFCICVLISSKCQNQSCSIVIFEISYAFLSALYLDYYRNSINIIYILKVWEKYLFLLVFIDALTMLLFPDGLYATSSYVSNWFLGYKTLRLIYALPLCVFRSILSYLLDEKSKKKSYIVFILVLFTLFYSGASAAAIGTSIILGSSVLADIVMHFKADRKKIGIKINEIVTSLVSNPIWIIPLYLFFIYGVFNISNFKMIQFIVERIFNKNITLTNRTMLWNSCLNLIMKSPLFGYGYKTADENRILFNNIYYTSPHNLALSILITAGMIGFICYLLIVFNAMQNLHKKGQASSMMLAFGIICELIVGITSSILLFAFCGFIFGVLSETNFCNLRNELKKNWCKK